MINPANGDVIGAVVRGTRADAEDALASAEAAWPGWSARTLSERVAAVEAWLDLIEADADRFATVIRTEVGTPVTACENVQVGLALDIARALVAEARTASFEQKLGNSLIRRVPAGVVVAITPWNVPMLLALQKVVPALLVGCTVVLKPSELTPLHAVLLARLTERSSLPPGVFNIVFGDGSTVGAALAASPRAAVLSFTGSVRAGREVARSAAANITQVHLELGGKSASLLLDDADVEAAVRASIGQAFFNSGQACLQWGRLVVPRRLRADVEALVRDIVGAYRVGDPADPATDVGPLISATARARVAEAVRKGLAEGARRLVGTDAAAHTGHPAGHFFTPTVFTGVVPEMELAQREIFGPVVSVMTHDGDDDAVRIANSTRYGLHGAVWSGSVDRASAVARRVRSGQVDINGAAFNPAAPFGGFGQSGIGRECGAEGLFSFTELQAVQMPEGTAGRTVRSRDGAA